MWTFHELFVAVWTLEIMDLRWPAAIWRKKSLRSVGSPSAVRRLSNHAFRIGREQLGQIRHKKTKARFLVNHSQSKIPLSERKVWCIRYEARSCGRSSLDSSGFFSRLRNAQTIEPTTDWASRQGDQLNSAFFPNSLIFISSCFFQACCSNTNEIFDCFNQKFKYKNVQIQIWMKYMRLLAH